MAWIDIKDRLPTSGTEVRCRLRHFSTKEIQAHQLLKVEEDDCSWRTADDRCEISYSWDVIEWYEESASSAQSS